MLILRRAGCLFMFLRAVFGSDFDFFEKFFCVQVVVNQPMHWCRCVSGEKKFWRNGKWLYLCTRFRPLEGAVEKGSARTLKRLKQEIACVNHYIKDMMRTRRRVKEVRGERKT